MSPTPDPRPRPGDHRTDEAPTPAEIAELTRRLRALSTRGRHVDPAERAAVLAEKQMLLAHIAASEVAAGPVDGGCVRSIEADHADGDGNTAGWSR